MTIKATISDEGKKLVKVTLPNWITRSLLGISILFYAILSLQTKSPWDLGILLFLLFLLLPLVILKNIYARGGMLFLVLVLSLRPMISWFNRFIEPHLQIYFGYSSLWKYAFNDFVLLLLFLSVLLIILRYLQVDIKRIKDIEGFHEISSYSTFGLIRYFAMTYIALGFSYLVYFYPIKPIEKLIQAGVLVSLIFFMAYINRSKKTIEEKIKINFKTSIFATGFISVSILSHYLWKFIFLQNKNSLMELMPNMEMLALANPWFLNIYPFIFLGFLFWVSLNIIFLFSVKLFLKENWSKFSEGKISLKDLDKKSKDIHAIKVSSLDYTIFFFYFLLFITPGITFLFKMIMLILGVGLIVILGRPWNKKKVERDEKVEMDNIKKEKTPYVKFVKIHMKNFSDCVIRITPRILLLAILSGILFLSEILHILTK